jgi:hypothetical protein
MNPNPLKITVALIAGLIILVAFVIPGMDLTDRIRKSLETYRTNYSPEKVYIHHDKPYYGAGEPVWIKAYVVDAASLKASEKSGVLYVDLLNEEMEEVERLTLPISDGEAHGDLILPDDLDEGIYHLAAYTQWMRNFGEETFFQKDIYILDATADKAGPSTAHDESKIKLHFFPESGDLIAGIPNEVAFKAVDVNGYGVSISGTLFTGDGVKILDFEDTHLGMGSFSLNPERDKKYFAKLDFKNAKTVDYPLPDVLAEGYVLHIDEVSDEEDILVRVSTNLNEGMTLVLLAIGGEELIYAEQLLPHAASDSEILIPKSIFPNGVARFTLAKETGEPIAERLIFVRHVQTHQVKVNTDKSEYHPREEVKLSLHVDGQLEEPVISGLSVAVTAEGLVHHSEGHENIQSYLLLSSDLKGRVESPGYYFESDEVERQLALRHLMMTQGWRRFEWNDLVSQQFPKIQYNNELDLNIRGRLLKSNGEPVREGEALLYLKDQFQTFITTPTNEEGYFVFRGFYFKGDIQVVIQGSDHQGRREDVEVHMLDSYLPSISETRSLLPTNFNTHLPEDYVRNTQKQAQSIETEVWGTELGELLLEEVVVEGRAEIHEPFKLHSQADVVLSREQLPFAPSGNVLESLQGRVAGLQVTRDGMNGFRAVIRGQGTPLYLLDGMPISESTLQAINQFDISRIEILKSPAATGIYGGRGGGGVVALYTDRAHEELLDVENEKYIIVHQASGFNFTRQFYSPVFEDIGYFDFPDLRSTIYWNPMITLNNFDNKTLSFFTADTPGTYRVIIEGITQDGQPLHQETLFEVGRENE